MGFWWQKLNEKDEFLITNREIDFTKGKLISKRSELREIIDECNADAIQSSAMKFTKPCLQVAAGHSQTTS